VLWSDRESQTSRSVLSRLAGGDLRSDGRSNEAVRIVLRHPRRLVELYEGLYSPSAVVRGRTADALEKIARTRPDLLVPRLQELVRISRRADVAMVRMHLAMLFGHLAVFERLVPSLARRLLQMSHDPSAYVRGWVVASLGIVARRRPGARRPVRRCLGQLVRDPSPAVRNRARRAMLLLTDSRSAFPPGWIKSPRLGALLAGPRSQAAGRTSLITARTFPSLSGKKPIHSS